MQNAAQPGSQVHEVFSDTFVRSKMDEIAPTPEFGLGQVNDKVLAEVLPVDSFGRLVLGITNIKKLFPVGVEFKDGAKEDETAMQEAVHYKALSDLVAFLDASGTASIFVPDVTFGPNAVKMPVELAVAHLQMMVQIKDLVAVAALQYDSLLSSKKGAAVTSDELFGKVVHVQCILSKSLVRIDSLLLSTEIKELEKSKWVGPISVEATRQWIKSVAVFA
eukprot:1029204-Pyramimonas_sp.AAC.2